MFWQALALFGLVLSWMDSLAPGRDHTYLAWAVATIVPAEHQALATAVAFRESSLRPDAVGDGGHSFCAFQVNDSSGGSELLTHDVTACVQRGWTLLERSIRIDPSHPVAAYARGPRWKSKEAQRISNERVALAKKLAQP